MAKKKNPTPRHQEAPARPGEKPGQVPEQAREPIQFPWGRDWRKKVVPYLKEELVQASLDFGMTLLDKTWKRGDAPCDYDETGSNRIVKGTLPWYQPERRCHNIAFFSMAIGVMNYPDLDWRFVSGHLHTVAVGYDATGEPRVVMDILQFQVRTAKGSIAFSQIMGPPVSNDEEWDKSFRSFVATMVPRLKARARELRAAKAHEQTDAQP